MANESGNSRSSDGEATLNPASKIAQKNIENEAEVDKRNVDRNIARSLGTQLQMLTDEFWGHLPACVENINLQENELTLSIRLPLLSPQPSGDSGDRRATKEEVDQIRIGFADFLRERQLVSRRLAGFFYSEFYDFLLRYSKIYRFNEDIRKLIKRPGERRLAGRPALPIPGSRKVAVTQQVKLIYAAVLEMQKKISEWKRKKPQLTMDAIRDLLKVEYDRERYPWSRYAFRNVSALPEKRGAPLDQGQAARKEWINLPKPTIAEPDRWSAPDLAVRWTQEWLFAEHGCRYDLRAIRKLL